MVIRVNKEREAKLQAWGLYHSGWWPCYNDSCDYDGQRYVFKHPLVSALRRLLHLKGGGVTYKPTYKAQSNFYS